MNRISKYCLFVGLICVMATFIYGFLNYFGLISINDEEAMGVFALYCIGGTLIMFPPIYRVYLDFFKKD